ncbi:amino acid adenylation domain-containing protein [Actinacidiphila yanglinensis]|uniref:Amino acid adenylation domain-containing protein n=1 Tax=Actinacidiphila yanglinensis TaxID=310779 RepID=A0A1H6DGN0_9ACTN|nr:non-ribosomal peptide synthetase [Actinacidiphila yanglinensis]SEG84374.1 amino acid adenylation domain-containing protein [Actinacidiphila yanglinensis]
MTTPTRAVEAGKGAAVTHTDEEPLTAETSFAQQSLWLVDRVDPGQPTYNVLAAVRMRGPLDPVALRAALNSVVERHESLRTVFGFDGYEPLQSVLPELRLELPIDEVGDADIDALVLREIEKPFDLAAGPLLRMRLLRRDAEDHVAVLTVHHIVTDGWSSGILFQELSLCYEAHAAGRAPALEPLPIQYVDYAVWQRDTLHGPALDKLVGYWRDRLAGLVPLRLPTDRPRPATASSAGGLHAFELPASLNDRLERLARSHECTPFMLYLAVFSVLLSRHSGSRDIPVASPVSGRDRSELAGLIGFFVNTLVLRLDTSGDPTFAEMLGRAREACLGAYAHQDLPYERLVEELRPPRYAGLGGPLAQVMFSLQNLPEQKWSVGELSYEAMHVATRTAKFDLSLELTPGPGGTRGTLEYSTDLFDRSSVEKLAEQFTELLTAVADDPAARISRLRLLPDRERARILAAGTPAPDPAADCVHRVFARQAAATPDAVALVQGNDRVTYRSLDCRADRLARHLRASGVVAETRVAVFLNRSPELVTAYLAVLKAGGVYVPLDPGYPQDRLRFMLADSAAPFVLSTPALAPLLPASAARVVAVDAPLPDTPAGPPPDLAHPDHGAYLIYTSGSTGQPKGAMNTHRGVTGFALAAAGAFGLHQDDRALQLAPLGFDVVAEELYPHLLTGGSVALPEGEPPVDTGELWDLVASSGATVLSTTPSRLAAIGPAERAAIPPTLRTLVFGSEAAPTLRTLLPWKEWPGRLVQVYGVTEASCTSAAAAVDFDGEPDAVVPLGTPLPGCRAHVLDPWFEPVPDGVAGELYLGGPSVSRGYHGRPGLTAARFVPDPFGTVPGARLYRTGDLVSRRSDGTLRFVERADRQVKIRGFRVEPSEVEASLSSHPALSGCVVENRPDAQGQARLAAYTVARDPDGPGSDELRAFLAEKLPAWMLPAVFVPLTALPLTANGKLDRGALPEPARESTTPYTPPRTPVEEGLARIWEELLGADRVGVHDDFFELGGNSLSAVRMISEVRDEFGVEVPLRTLFSADPTVAELGNRIFELLLEESADDAQEVAS